MGRTLDRADRAGRRQAAHRPAAARPRRAAVAHGGARARGGRRGHRRRADLPPSRRPRRSAVAVEHRRRATPILAPPGAARWLAANGLRNVQQIAAGERASVGGVTVSATPASHDGRRWPLGPGADRRRLRRQRLTVLLFRRRHRPVLRHVRARRHDRPGAAARVGMGSRRSDPDTSIPSRAATAARLIAPRVAVPIHWGTFSLGWPARRPADPAAPRALVRRAAAREAPAVEVRLLAARRAHRGPQPPSSAAAARAERERE